METNSLKFNTVQWKGWLAHENRGGKGSYAQVSEYLDFISSCLSVVQCQRLKLPSALDNSNMLGSHVMAFSLPQRGAGEGNGLKKGMGSGSTATGLQQGTHAGISQHSIIQGLQNMVGFW